MYATITSAARIARFGKFYCTSHYIKMKDINALVLADI